MSLPSPAFDLLRPRLPSRRTRVAAALSAALLAAALLDLIAVLTWSALAVQAARLQRAIEEYRQQEARANALAARSGAAAREVTQIRARLSLLKGLPAGVTRSEALLGAINRALPAGGTLNGVTLGADQRLILTGTVPTYAAVEAYVRALEATGDFAYVRVVSIASSQGGPSGGSGQAAPGAFAPPSGAVEFQLESWLRGEGTR